ncbi:AraC family transcriptional regulator [Nitratireductor soli]|uniref:AraC family transcriptional regulator n=1 Tax=Nitratireductor soli TaxID=1670619 RepID=UPI00065E0EDB|nr:AraC family transcriptional regulator [Nitratireductor soli]
MEDRHWRNYAEFYQRSGYSSFQQEHRHSEGCNRFAMIMVDQLPHSFCDPAVGETIIAIPLTSDRDYVWRWRLEGRDFAREASSGETIIIPSGVESEWDVDAARRVLILTVPDTTMQSTLKTDSATRIRDTFEGFAGTILVDSFVHTAMIRLWNALASKDAMERRVGGNLMPTLLWHLLSQLDDQRHLADQVYLPLWRLKRVEEFIEANLQEKIGITDLASAADLSVRHFSRSFFRELGTTPHKWLMKRRLEHACKLLSSSSNGIGEIARDSGFSSQSHLTTLMKQSYGTTPNRYRDLNREQ